MATLDPIAHLKGFVQRTQSLLINDLKAIPSDKQNICPGGCARSPLNVVAECAGVNGRVAQFLQTGVMPARPSDEERKQHLASFTTEVATLEFLQTETEKLLSALDSFDPARLGETTEEFFGRPMTLFQIAELPSVHMMYHDGQLNYIQTLHGDSDMHWG